LQQSLINNASTSKSYYTTLQKITDSIWDAISIIINIVKKKNFTQMVLADSRLIYEELIKESIPFNNKKAITLDVIGIMKIDLY
jgi:hypothetical protein